MPAIGIRKWLSHKAEALQYNASGMMRSFLRYTSFRKISFACGMVGGSREMLLPALAWVLDSYRAHWARNASLKLVAGLDMLLWTDKALRLRGAHVVTGYPVGPANLPMTWYPWRHGIKFTDDAAARDFVNETRGMYWLAHHKQSVKFHSMFEVWTAQCRQGRGLPSAASASFCEPKVPMIAPYVREWR